MGKPLHQTELHVGADSASALVRILDEYLSSLKGGSAPDRAALLARHPELAGQLESCLAALDFIHQADRPGTEAPAQLGEFRIVREIGRGGMGVVYEAEQLSLKRRVALKVLRFGGPADAEAMQRFRREAETIARLHHTNIVPVFAVGEDRNVPYYAMQFIDGEPLDKAARRPSGGYSEIARWGQQAAEALAHAHARGVIHRDIKPSNLLLDKEGTVWLTDFGLAHRADEVTLTVTGLLMGTPRYMSPEQASAAKNPVDQRSDIYSLGATLYELTTGQPVHDGDTPQRVLAQIQEAEPITPRSHRPDLPRDLETILMKCLAKEPARRYQTAQDLAEDLRRFAAGDAIKARRPSMSERVGRWWKKQKKSAVVAGAGGLAAAALLIGAILVWQWRERSKLGLVRLTSDGPALVAELLDADREQRIMPAFTVPTQQPVEIPEGEYRLRLTCEKPGILSETYRLSVRRGRQQHFTVDLPERHLWRPVTLDPSRRDVEFFADGARTDLLIPGYQTLQRVHGGTGLAMWKTKTNESGDDLSPYGSDPAGRPFFLPPRDLNGDGEVDVVFASRAHPVVVALSGKDGKLLWRHVGFAPVAGIDESKRRYGPVSSVIGQPLWTDVDRDGTPDVLAVFVSQGESVIDEKGVAQPLPGGMYHTWAAAVSGKSGQAIWRTKLSARQGYNRPGHTAALREEDGTPILHLLFDEPAQALRLDALTGQLLGTADFGSGLPATRAPVLVEANGQPEGWLMKTYHSGAQVGFYPLGEAKPRWFTAPDLVRYEQDEVLEPADLDGDGYPEAPVADGRRIGVLDLQTGTLRWQVPIRSVATSRCMAGPDLDGDGVREVFAASFINISGTYRSEANWERRDELMSGELLLEALSGRDGKRLWLYRHRSLQFPWNTQKITSLRWWNANMNGWPQLVVTWGDQQRSQTAVFAASDGRFIRSLVAPSDPLIADLDGDGWTEMIFMPRQGPDNGTLRAIRGGASQEWARLEQPRSIRPGSDYDGDGRSDLVSSGREQTSAVSSRAGHTLWSRPLEISGNDSILAPLDDSDLDGDGVADVLRCIPLPPAMPANNKVEALSGRDGKTLWEYDLGLRDGDYYHAVAGAYGTDAAIFVLKRLEPNSKDVLFGWWIAHSNASQYSRSFNLARLDARTGRLTWRERLVAISETGEQRFAPAFADCNGDGCDDILLWLPRPSAELRSEVRLQLTAYNGKDGKHIWNGPVRLRRGSGEPMPAPLVADLDGDGAPEIALLNEATADFGSLRGPERLLILDGTTGQERAEWKLKPGQPGRAVPQTIRSSPVLFRTGKQNLIALRIGEHPDKGPMTEHILLVGVDGKERGRIPVQITPEQWQHPFTSALSSFAALQQPSDRIERLASADLEGSSRDTLLFFSGEKLCATRSESGELLWEYTLPCAGNPFVNLGIRGFLPSADGKAGIVVLQVYTEVIGLDGATGKVRWRGNGHGFVPADGKGNGPWLLDNPTGRDGVVLREVMHFDVDGKLMRPAAAPLSFGESPRDPRWAKRLPLARDHGPQLIVPVVIGCSGFVAAFLWLRWSRGRRSWWRLAIGYLAVALLLSWQVVEDFKHMGTDGWIDWSGLDAAIAHALTIPAAIVGAAFIVMWPVWALIWMVRKFIGRMRLNRGRVQR